MKGEHPVLEWLGRTRVMRQAFEAVEAWFDRMAEREERKRARTAPPAHEETSTLVWCDPDTVLYQYVTATTWIRNGSIPATCVACRSQHGLVLGWLSGHEHRARFRCLCGVSWCDPLWARQDATDHVRNTPSEFERINHDDQ